MKLYYIYDDPYLGYELLKTHNVLKDICQYYQQWTTLERYVVIEMPTF